MNTTENDPLHHELSKPLMTVTNSYWQGKMFRKMSLTTFEIILKRDSNQQILYIWCKCNKAAKAKESRFASSFFFVFCNLFYLTICFFN